MVMRGLRSTILVSCVVLGCYANGKMSDFFGFTATQMVKEGRLTRNEIDIMQDWLHINNYTNVCDEQIVQFLLSCDRNLELTRNTIKEYYESRKNSKDIFTNRDLDSPELQNISQIGLFNIIPKRTKEGSAVILFKMSSSDRSKFDTAASMKMVTMAMDAVINEYPPKDLIMIFDVEKMSFMHLFSINLGVVSRYLTYLQDGLPVKLKNIHVLNMMGAVDTLLSWIKPLMKEKTRNMMLTYPKSYDMNDFYEIVEKECLPKDYGGNQASVEELNEITMAKLKKLKSYFDAEEDQRNNMKNSANISKHAMMAYLGVLVLLFITII